jgi:pimeloyl-ACP methyl ester carboxylesterase
MFIAAGFTVVPVIIHWKRFDLGWLPEYAQAVEKAVLPEPHERYLLGFSWGAIAALVAAKRIKPEALVLCSLSPYFNEDRFLAQQFLAEKNLLRYYTEEQDTRMRALSFVNTVRSVASRTFVLYGEKEPPVLVNRCVLAGVALQALITRVPKAQHDIVHPEYTRALRLVSKRL